MYRDILNGNRSKETLTFPESMWAMITILRMQSIATGRDEVDRQRRHVLSNICARIHGFSLAKMVVIFLK